MKDQVHLQLRGVVFQEHGWWIGHCLELDIVAQGDSPIAVVRDLMTLCDMQIRTALDMDNLRSIFRPAPAEIWELWARVEKGKSMPQSRLPHSTSRFEVREMQIA